MATTCLRLLALLLAAASAAGGGGAACNATQRVSLEARMPPYATRAGDAYLCTSLQLPAEPLKLVGVEALADPEVVHHILVFGCRSPARTETVWECHMSRACGVGQQESVLYGWGKGAPGLELPEGVGFSVGPGSGISTVVMQVHYLPVRPEGDASGVRLSLTAAPVPRSAGMAAFAAGFHIPPGRPSVPVAHECCNSGPEPLTAFGFRVHTHWMGRSVYIQRQPPGAAAPEPAFARQDPQLPQGFYSIDPPVTIHPGDRLRMTCEFDSSNETRVVSSGYTSRHEMCNLYLMVHSQVPYFMYCVDGRELHSMDGAGSLPGPHGQLESELDIWRPPTTVELAEGDAMQLEAPLGQVAGVAASPRDGTLWVLHRGSRPWVEGSFDGERLHEQDPIVGPVVLQLRQDTGEVVQSWGSSEFFMPHMISVDPDGNLWITDVGLHQALKYSPDGRKLMELGRRLTPGHDNTTFCKPTHAMAGRDGSIYVADGYCNSRVLHFNASGHLRGQFALPAGALRVPHALALQECRRLLYVADREARAVHAFRLDGGGLAGTWELGSHGLPYDLRLGPYGLVLVLAWDRGGTGATRIVALDGAPGAVHGVWEVPGAVAPHALALLPAPLQLTGPAERRLAAVVGETRPPGAGPSRLLKLAFPGHGGAAGAAGAAPGAPAAPTDMPGEGAAAAHIGHTMLRPVDGSLPGPHAPANATQQHEKDGAAARAAQEALVAAAVGRPVLPQGLAARQAQRGGEEGAAGGRAPAPAPAPARQEAQQVVEEPEVHTEYARVRLDPWARGDRASAQAAAAAAALGGREAGAAGALGVPPAYVALALGAALLAAAGVLLRWQAAGWRARRGYHAPHAQGAVAHVA